MDKRAASAQSVSPEAAALIGLVPNLDDATLRSIERLLLAGLAHPSGRELRAARLGLLVELVTELSGEIPTVEQYEARRDSRSAAGDSWPSSSSLADVYGGQWNLAVRAAMRLAFEGPRSRVPHTLRHARFREEFTRDEVIAAIRRFAEEHDGRMPSAEQYYSWGEHLRRAARHGGRADPRIPSRTAVRRHFASFALAKRAAATRG